MIVKMLKKLSLKPQQDKSNLSGLFALGFLAVILVAMISIVLVQHNIRNLETAYAKMFAYQKQHHGEWGRLILEKHHLSAPARVEQIARENLNMTINTSDNPNQHQTIVLEIPSDNLILLPSVGETGQENAP